MSRRSHRSSRSMAMGTAAAALLALFLLAGSPSTAWAGRNTGPHRHASPAQRLCGCPPIQDPVCGSPDGGKTFNTYENKCFAECAGVKHWIDGRCNTPITPPPKKPSPSHLICSDIYDPVCGINGVTYPNSCVAKNAGISSWTEGACRTGVCGCPPILGADVCATNNVTYSSPCVAQCEHGEEIAYYGMCTNKCAPAGAACLLDSAALPPNRVPAHEPCCAGSKCIEKPGHLVGQVWGMCSYVL